jgi:indole-3-glycerol phosphate synthase
MNILDEIAGKTKLRVATAKKTASFDQVREKAIALAVEEGSGEWGGANKVGVGSREEKAKFPFERALAAPGLSFICEVKKASPSKGIIAEDFPYLQIALEYEGAGAAAISVLTEPDYFLGSDQYLREIAAAVAIPALRKDFIVDPYQIYEAKILGAKAVLLICALLNTETLAEYIKTANELGLSSLVEIHDEAEAEQAVRAGAKIIGINNRDLKTFKVDIAVTARLRSLIPAGILSVAESGVKSAKDVRAISGFGIDAVLVGESLMRAADKKQFLAELKGVGDRELSDENNS